MDGYKQDISKGYWGLGLFG